MSKSKTTPITFLQKQTQEKTCENIPTFSKNPTPAKYNICPKNKTSSINIYISFKNNITKPNLTT